MGELVDLDQHRRDKRLKTANIGLEFWTERMVHAAEMLELMSDTKRAVVTAMPDGDDSA